ncbi:MAG: tRNA (adenine(22)-N(1))-methyltransferase TrmK [Oligoflexales bacterium]|nr:tRNA (adenine(22)-N(1))-methyltransferase TrmK [Oligoflexales bacterium]
MVQSANFDKIVLSKRLGTICRFILPGYPLYDICSDHGLVGLYARSIRLVPEIFLVDKSAKATSSLKARCDRYLPEDSMRHIICVDARKWQLLHSRATVVISGVGGATIGEILDTLFAEMPMNHRLILSPFKTVQSLRRYIADRGWKEIHNEAVAEGRRLRDIIVVE